MATSIDSYNDLTELGIDLQADCVLDDHFDKAAKHVQKLVSKLDNQNLLPLYGYYKQATEGMCTLPKPSWYDLKAKSKWEAWSKLGEMTKNQAKTLYIEAVSKLDPNFSNKPSQEQWVYVSTLQNNEIIDESNKTLFDLVKDCDCVNLGKHLEGESSGFDDLVEDGLGLIHWAADRGSVDVLKILLDFDCNINLQDKDGQTALHYASSCGHLDVVRFLLDNRADKSIRDNDGLAPFEVAGDEGIKTLLLI